MLSSPTRKWWLRKARGHWLSCVPAPSVTEILPGQKACALNIADPDMAREAPQPCQTWCTETARGSLKKRRCPSQAGCCPTVDRIWELRPHIFPTLALHFHGPGCKSASEPPASGLGCWHRRHPHSASSHCRCSLWGELPTLPWACGHGPFPTAPPVFCRESVLPKGR